MIFQDNVKFNKEIQNTGCHVLSLLYIVYGDDLHKLTAEEVTILLDEFKRLKIVTSDYYCMYPQVLLNSLNSKQEYLGIQPLTYDLNSQDMILALFQWDELKHFVVLDSEFHLLYDPIRSGSKTYTNGKLKNIRIISPLLR